MAAASSAGHPPGRTTGAQDPSRGRWFRASGWAAVSLAALGMLAGCASVPSPGPTPASAPPAAFAAGWEPVPLPGKRPTRYEVQTLEGRPVWHADAQRSASMWRKRLQVPANALGAFEFTWRVDQLMSEAVVADADQDDAAARVMVAFDGDHAQLSARNRMLFDLADTLTGERPPYATLMYVWADGRHPPETVLHSPRTDRVRKIVIESGPGHLGQWRRHRRDLAVDFQRAFGEAPGNVLGVALMTDSDNTGARAQAWYADIELHTRPTP
jgi:Protein of unknown function (DUF3047)